MTEIELKAHVRDPAETERIILGFAEARGEVLKRDVYWRRPGPESPPGAGPAKSGAGSSARSIDEAIKLRIRDEGGKAVVTYKRKELRADIEVNDEREFAVSDRAALECLITDLGFEPYISKEKRTKSFAFAGDGGIPVTIELSLVTGLGWFVEIEILMENPGETETGRARKLLRETLARCGIPESELEPRFYTDLLREREALA